MRLSQLAARLTFAVILASAAGCRDQGPADPQPLGPTNVEITMAAPTRLDLRNTGGPGSFYAEAWGRITTNSPSGCHTADLIDGRCPMTAQFISEYPVSEIAADTDRSINVMITGADVFGYKIFSRSEASATWTQTDCERAVSGAWLTFNC